MRLGTFLITACVGLAPLTAAAQETPASPAPQGPMTIERIHNEFVVAPEFRVTDIDGETGELVGVSGGRVFDSALFVGAGGYWLVDASRGTDMGYGGLVVEWRQRTDHFIGYSFGTLAGFGRATRELTLSIPVRGNGRDGGRNSATLNQRLRFNTDFFIVEPEAGLVFNLSHRLHLHTGVGYRATTASTRNAGSLDGATATLRLQVGF
jgi:hypothetical protein